MDLLFFCPMWGMADGSLRDMLLKIKQAGYDGIEFGFRPGDPQRETFMELARELDLITIGQQCFAAGKDFASYRESYREHLEWLVSFEPYFINCHTGKDYYSFEQNAALIGIAVEIEKISGVKIVHETHRGTFSFCVAQCGAYLNTFPALNFTADFSHFCTVSESYLEDQQELLVPIMERSHHIHARVGHPQGAQVTDPRLPEWAFAVEKHLAWWDTVVDIGKQKKHRGITITPEFGPAPYMAAAPFTQQPLANQWEINLYMMQLLKSRYN
ncbi:sugar phosphate isomerase/epimerase [Chitinophaga sp. MM2321]|uniref:sugar phosphate isomerase/epimerase family protein n=1 Tax=Chitinophaga sp. MM2321 TaxID=3137178 RepID=UPI0032D57FF3